MNRHSGFGFSTILLTFVMICMATFCALALMTAQSDYRLSKKVADNSDAYCIAERNAYLTLATIDAALFALYDSAGDPESYYSVASDKIPELCNGSYRLEENRHLVTFCIPISENQHLEVELALHYPNSGADTFYTINRWQKVQDADGFIEEPLHLMQ